ncbi:MAG: hypothetical protein DRP85_06665 [Candidatus Makaraimicrobium thalassicum]|nr:MAG: hypothetical protein DRP85_06665 [Candidatus Omnitrophota bacterium]
MRRIIVGMSVASFICAFSFPGAIGESYADTVILKGGKRVKGLILDEFRDRITLSTAEGEKTIKRSDIRSAVYDSEEKALIREGENQLTKGHYIKAYYLYEKALRFNPDLERARERLHYIRGYLETEARRDVIRSIVTRREGSGNAGEKTPVRRVADELGLVLAPGAKYVRIEKIMGSNPSGRGAELRPGDRIVAVCGEMTAYMDVDEVAGILLVPGEIRFAIERTVVPELSSAGALFDGLLFSRYKKIVGAGLKLRNRGVTVNSITPGGPFEAAGIRKGDLLHRINGKNTRYMPLSEVTGIIKKNQNKKIEIVIRRDITFWRKG